MRTVFAILIAICSAIWVYGSLRFYNCIRSQACDYWVSNASLEVVVMLLWAFIFGYIFGNILSGFKKRKYIKRSQLDNLKWSYTQSKKYWLYKNEEVDAIFEETKESHITETNSEIDKKISLDRNKSAEKIRDTTIDTSIDKPNFNQNTGYSNSENLNNSANVDIKKKSLFWNFLDDVNLSNETNTWESENKVDTQKIIKEVKKEAEVKNIPTNKTVKYTSNDSSIKKVHEKNLRTEKTKDDLTKIEWIGPKIAELLNNNNIYTFIDLARTDPFELSGILTAAGSRFQMHNPKTWPQQSVFAAKGEWNNLKEYQKRLNGWRA